MAYTPDFGLEERDNRVWVRDGEQDVVCFDPSLVRFGHGRLTPGGYEMFPRPGMRWGPFGWLLPFWKDVGETLLSFDANATPSAVAFDITTTTPGCMFESHWEMEITWEPELRCYCYEVVATMTTAADYDPARYAKRTWEYYNLEPQGMFPYNTGPQFRLNGEILDFPAPLWGFIVYQRRHLFKPAHWVKVPVNRLVTSASMDIRVAPGGYAGFMNSPVGNPMVQLLDDTAAFTCLHQCNWFYDLHFVHDMADTQAPPEPGFSVAAHFRIVNFDTVTTAEVLRDAVLVSYPEPERREKRFPRYEPDGRNSFEHAISIDDPDHSKVWHAFHHHIGDYHPGIVNVHYNNTPENLCLWVDNCARTGTRSLHVATTVPGIAGWQTPLFERPIVEEGHRYRLSVHVRTEELEGRGATLGYFLSTDQETFTLAGMPTDPERARPRFADLWMTGTSDWTRVELVTVPAEALDCGQVLEYDLFACLLQPVLWHEGTGRSWFDDFVLEDLGPA